MITAGQIWQFAPMSGYRGECQIEEVNGYGQITGRFYDSIGNECRETVERDDLDYLVSDSGSLSGDPSYDDEPLEE